MVKQLIDIPTPEIIDDLLIDNWELRWQVLDIFYQVRTKIKNFTKPSPYHRSLAKLCNQTINTLQSENDLNLHLIILAVYLLDGLEGIFQLLDKLDIANIPKDTALLLPIREKILSENYDHTFFDYFLSLFKEGVYWDSTVVLSLKIFEAEELLELFCSSNSKESQTLAFKQLQQEFPLSDFNKALTANNLQLINKKPQSLTFLQLPLEPAVFKQVESMALTNLNNHEYLETTLEACAKLKLSAAIPQIAELLTDQNLHFAATAALGKLGSIIALLPLLSAGHSFFGGRKMEAAKLLGNYQDQQAIDCLKKLSASHNKKVREIALNSLVCTGQIKALTILIDHLIKAPAKEKKTILANIAHKHWPDVPEKLVEKIIPLTGDPALIPEIFKAIKSIGHGHLLLPQLKKLGVPLKTEHHKAFCLFLARYADIPAIKDALLPHLQHPDWGFSYQLLYGLQDHFTIGDFPTLFALLQLRESYKPLTIKERLEMGKGEDDFIPAMCNYLNLHPQVAHQLLFSLNNHLLTGKLPIKKRELEEIFSGHAVGLKQLVVEHPFEHKEISPEGLYVLLLFCVYLDKITVDGVSCFAIIVNKTRKYSGFFSETIWSIILKILQSERTSTDTALLPYLDQLLKILRGRKEVDKLRVIALTIKKRIFTSSRDLTVFVESNRYRDLQIFKVKKLHG
jgi:hypothetical protein